MSPEYVLYVARFAHLGASLIVFGGALFPLYARIDAPTPAGKALTTIAVLSALLWVAYVVLDIGGAGAFSDPDVLRGIFVGTGFGRAWVVHLALSGALALAVRARRPHFALVPVVAGLHLVTLAGVGHAAMDEGARGALHQAVHAMHLLAAGAWLGGVVALWRVLRTRPPDAATSAARRFSRMGYIAAPVVVLTGIVNTNLVTGAWLPDVGRRYGVLLAVKIALVAALLAVAGFNRLARRDGVRGAAMLSGGILIEQALFAAILAAVSIFGAQSPH